MNDTLQDKRADDELLAAFVDELAVKDRQEDLVQSIPHAVTMLSPPSQKAMSMSGSGAFSPGLGTDMISVAKETAMDAASAANPSGSSMGPDQGAGLDGDATKTLQYGQESGSKPPTADGVLAFSAGLKEADNIEHPPVAQASVVTYGAKPTQQTMTNESSDAQAQRPVIVPAGGGQANNESRAATSERHSAGASGNTRQTLPVSQLFDLTVPAGDQMLAVGSAPSPPTTQETAMRLLWATAAGLAETTPVADAEIDPIPPPGTMPPPSRAMDNLGKTPTLVAQPLSSDVLVQPADLVVSRPEPAIDDVPGAVELSEIKADSTILPQSHPSTGVAVATPSDGLVPTLESGTMLAGQTLGAGQAGPMPPGQHPVRTTHPSLVQQAKAALARFGPDQTGRIDLTLAPDTLGRVNFDMRPEGAALSITLSAERPETLELIRRHLPELLAELKEAGVQAGTLSFGTWSGGHNPQQSPSPDRDSESVQIYDPPQTHPSPAQRPLAPSNGGLDLRL